MERLILKDVVAGIHDLPSLPVVVLEVMQSMNEKNPDTHVMAEKIAQDQALTAKVLRLANSSFYGMQRRVVSIQQAITILGISSVRTLIIAAAVIDIFATREKSTFNFLAFWRHSIGTALCAKALARKKACNQDEAFLTGLLHDIGRLVLLTHAPVRYEAVLAERLRQDSYLHEAEHSILGIDHMIAGRALMEYWKFPGWMLETIEHHHMPEPQRMNALVAILNLADCAAHGLDFSGDEHDLVPPLSATGWALLSLSGTDIGEVSHEAEMQFEEACAIFSFPSGKNR